MSAACSPHPTALHTRPQSLNHRQQRTKKANAYQQPAYEDTWRQICVGKGRQMKGCCCACTGGEKSMFILSLTQHRVTFADKKTQDHANESKVNGVGTVTLIMLLFRAAWRHQFCSSPSGLVIMPAFVPLSLHHWALLRTVYSSIMKTEELGSPKHWQVSTELHGSHSRKKSSLFVYKLSSDLGDVIIWV
jgi:hypothetical protein